MRFLAIVVLSEVVNIGRLEAKGIVTQVRTELEQTLLTYLRREEKQGLSCVIDAMSRGRTL